MYQLLHTSGNVQAKLERIAALTADNIGAETSRASSPSFFKQLDPMIKEAVTKACKDSVASSG